MPVDTPKTAMLLSAGLGLRMRPLTADRPKPLIEVAGRALIDHGLDRLAEAGVGTAVVNVHYRADMLAAHVGRRARPRVLISDERDLLLESGGGVAKALPLLGAQPFFLLNADSFWIDGASRNLDSLARTYDPAVMDMLLLLAERERAVGFDGPGDFARDAAGRLARRGAAPAAPFVYAGAFIVSPGVFAGAPAGPFSLNLLFDRALAAGRLFGLPLDGLWLHVGTPAAIAEAEAAIAAFRGRT